MTNTRPAGSPLFATLNRFLLPAALLGAAVLAVGGGYMFFGNVPDSGAAAIRSIAQDKAQAPMDSAALTQLQEERMKLAPKPGGAERREVETGAGPRGQITLPGETPDGSGGRYTLERPAAQTLNEMQPAAPLVQDLPDLKEDAGTALYRAGKFAEALNVWRSRAAEGQADAAFRLGQALTDGAVPGAPQDAAEGARFLKQAADDGHGEALLLLGRLYEQGRGVAADPVAALACYLKAQTRLSTSDAAAAEIARLKAQLTSAQIAEAERQAQGP